MNSKLSDPKAKIVGLEESYKPQAFSESFEFLIFHSWLISVRGSSVVCETSSLSISLDHLFDSF
jgi:hypothetical protein